MADGESPTISRRPAALSFADFVYRCVCGESLRIDPVTGADCPKCGRHFQADVLLRDGGETIVASQCERRGAKSADDDAAADPLIGQRWEHFLILEQLGRGGMGAVYRALDESLQRYVALKVIRGGNAGGQDSPQMQQLIQEARAQARVNHPHVVHIYFVGRSEGVPFFAMELVGGETLEQRLREGPLPFAEVVRVARQVASALQQAVRYDIVHGDIKPSNILQADDANVKLSDFGLAQRLSELKSGSGQVAGTPNYLSPETAAGKAVDFRGDMYSLGVTLFELTFGKLPYAFSSSSLEERLAAHRTRKVEYPEPWPETVPEVWREVLDRLLAKSPEDRYASYDELLADLERVRPLSLPPAGRLQRGLAWLVDLSIVLGAQAMLLAPLSIEAVQELLGRRPLLRLLSAATAAVVPFLAASFQCWAGSSPGKKLFQLRVVDQHGLPPSSARMAPRSVSQFFIAWGVAATLILKALRLDALIPLTNLVIGLQVVTEIGFALFTKRRLALHDRVLGTQVVLDAGRADAG